MSRFRAWSRQDVLRCTAAVTGHKDVPALSDCVCAVFYYGFAILHSKPARPP